MERSCGMLGAGVSLLWPVPLLVVLAEWAVSKLAEDFSWLKLAEDVVSVARLRDESTVWRFFSTTAVSDDWAVLKLADEGAVWAVLKLADEGTVWAVLKLADEGAVWAVLKLADEGAVWAVIKLADEGTIWAVLKLADEGTVWKLEADFIVFKPAAEDFAVLKLSVEEACLGTDTGTCFSRLAATCCPLLLCPDSNREEEEDLCWLAAESAESVGLR